MVLKPFSFLPITSKKYFFIEEITDKCEVRILRLFSRSMLHYMLSYNSKNY